MAGVKTTFLDTVVYASEVLANSASGTGRMSLADLSTQLASEGAIADSVNGLELNFAAVSSDADRAEAARDAAFVNADVYADTAAGIAATSDGEQFQVVDATGEFIQRYRNDAGVAEPILGAQYPAARRLTNIETLMRDGNNLFNSADPDILVDHRNNPANGIPVALANWSTSGFIPVGVNQTYYTNMAGYGAFYDENKNYVSSVSASPEWVAPVLTAPANGYVRLSYQSSSATFEDNQIYFVASSDHPSVIEPFGKIVRETGAFNLPTSALADNAVTPAKDVLWETGKNLANPAGAVAGYYMNTYGQPKANAAYSYLATINVVPGEVYTSNQDARFTAYVDAGGLIAGGLTSATSQWTIPDGVYGLILSITTSQLSNFQFEHGTVSTEFEEFHWKGKSALPTGEPVFWGAPEGSAIVSSINNSLGSTNWQGDTSVPSSYGLSRLRETHQRLRSIKGGKTGADAQLVISAIGDSWTHDSGRWPVKVARALWNEYSPDDPNVEYGPIGLGWIAFKGAGSGSYPNGAVYWNSYLASSGSWTSDNIGGNGPDLGAETSSDVGAYLQPQVNWDYDRGLSYELFAQGGSGVVRYRWTEAGAWTTVDLSALASGVQIISMTPPSSGSGRFRIEVVSGTCTLFGIYQKHATTEGIIFNKLGSTGSKLQQWTQADETEWSTSFAGLGSDLTTILHGTNDQSINRTKAQFKSDLIIMIDRIRAASPTTDILLITPAENQNSEPVPMSDYAAAMFEIARDDRDVAYLNLQDAFGESPADYAYGSARPWFASDGIHPDPYTGGWAMSDAILKALGE